MRKRLAGMPFSVAVGVIDSGRTINPTLIFPEAILNSTFDWNGKREPLTLATENDTLNGMSMLLAKLINQSASVFLLMLEPIGVRTLLKE